MKGNNIAACVLIFSSEMENARVSGATICCSCSSETRIADTCETVRETGCFERREHGKRNNLDSL